MAATQVRGSQVLDASLTDADVAAVNKDGTSGTYSLRTLGTGAQQACAGNDSRLSDARTPTAHASTHAIGGSDVVNNYDRWLFGDGSDGAVTISSNTTLTRSMYYSSLTLNIGMVLNCGGFRIHVSGTLTIDNIAAIDGGFVTAAGTSTTPTAGKANGDTGGSSQGGAGATGTTGAGVNGTAAPTVNPAWSATNTGTGSAGGSGTSGAGGTGGGCTAVTQRPLMMPWPSPVAFDGSTGVPTLIQGGQGGGGGASGAGDGTHVGGNGGAGGAGGAVLVVFARTITFNGAGFIRSNGQTGRSALAGTAGGNCGGGGGGGGGQGGIVLLAYETLTLGTGTISANGGTAGTHGAGSGTGAAGTDGVNGAAGTVLKFNTLTQAWE